MFAPNAVAAAAAANAVDDVLAAIDE
jgi:hypothetical protein